MRRARDRRHMPPGVGFNATPMVDVIFTLTIFFMLVSRFSSAEQVPMHLPKPAASQARTKKLPERVTVNCRLADPTAPDPSEVLYSLGPNQPEPLDVLAERLVAARRDAPGLKVVIRADRRIPYREVRNVMHVVAASGAEVLNVVAHVSEDE